MKTILFVLSLFITAYAVDTMKVSGHVVICDGMAGNSFNIGQLDWVKLTFKDNISGISLSCTTTSEGLYHLTFPDIKSDSLILDSVRRMPPYQDTIPWSLHPIKWNYPKFPKGKDVSRSVTNQQDSVNVDLIVKERDTKNLIQGATLNFYVWCYGYRWSYVCSKILTVDTSIHVGMHMGVRIPNLSVVHGDSLPGPTTFPGTCLWRVIVQQDPFLPDTINNIQIRDSAWQAGLNGYGLYPIYAMDSVWLSRVPQSVKPTISIQKNISSELTIYYDIFGRRIKWQDANFAGFEFVVQTTNKATTTRRVVLTQSGK